MSTLFNTPIITAQEQESLEHEAYLTEYAEFMQQWEAENPSPYMGAPD